MGQACSGEAGVAVQEQPVSAGSVVPASDPGPASVAGIFTQTLE